MEQYYRIAGLTVRMDSFGRTTEQAKPYLLNEVLEFVDIEIQSDWHLLKLKQPDLSEDDCEYLATGISFYKQLLSYNGLMLHSSGVVVDGRAYLFSAPCGTGKSTHTRLWLDAFGDRAYILNDDKPALRLEDGTWYAYGTPWSGKYDISKNTRVPLAGIAVLQRSGVNEISRFEGTEAIRSILNQVVRPRDTNSRVKLLELLDMLITQVPIWKLCCNMEPEAAMVSYRAMSGTK